MCWVRRTCEAFSLCPPIRCFPTPFVSSVSPSIVAVDLEGAVELSTDEVRESASARKPAMAAGRFLFPAHPRPLNGQTRPSKNPLPAVSRWFSSPAWSRSLQAAGPHGAFMSKKDKGRLPQFIPMLRETMRTPAWIATSKGARWLFVALKGRYSTIFHNNGKLYISSREAAREIGADQKEVLRWFRELQHYGFIVQTVGASLGVHGKGKAPHWRITELGTIGKDGLLVSPTRDYLRWDGTKFTDVGIPRRQKLPDGEIPSDAGKSPHQRDGKSPAVRAESAGETPCM